MPIRLIRSLSRTTGSAKSAAELGSFVGDMASVKLAMVWLGIEGKL